jgi:hypothetical protein
MGKGKSILIYLVILLFAVTGSSVLCSPEYGSAGHTLSCHLSHANNRSKTASFAHSLIKQDKLKVRYMGGECRYVASYFPLVIHSREFTDNETCESYISFESSCHYCLFKLRGPPQNIS